MSEYLERETAVNIADHAILEHAYDKESQRPETHSDYNQGWSDACKHIHARLAYVPAAGAAPVRRGRWIEKPYLLGTSRFCSRCGENYGMQHAIYRYCPNCGARMDGEESK